MGTRYTWCISGGRKDLFQMELRKFTHVAHYSKACALEPYVALSENPTDRSTVRIFRQFGARSQRLQTSLRRCGQVTDELRAKRLHFRPRKMHLVLLCLESPYNLPLLCSIFIRSRTNDMWSSRHLDSLPAGYAASSGRLEDNACGDHCGRHYELYIWKVERRVDRLTVES